MHNAHACYSQEKWPTLCMAVQGRECSTSATEQFYRKCHKFFDLVHVHGGLITHQSKTAPAKNSNLTHWGRECRSASLRNCYVIYWP